MKIFTYKDYIYSIHTYRLHAVMGVADNTEEYNRDETKETQRKKEIQEKHDKLIKNIFKNKKEFTKFINVFLNPKRELKEQELEKYTNSYINRKYQKKEADIVYKVKGMPIYYLIEHQSTIDYNMSYRILNYCIDIIQEWIKGKNTGRETKYPVVIPIVIYTGEKRWSIATDFADTQIKETTYGNNYIHLSYNLIDINKYSNENLLKRNTLFSYCMLIEKTNNTKEFVNTIKTILKQIKEKEILLEIDDIIQGLFFSSLTIDEQEIIKRELEEKVGETNMSTWIERIQAGDEKRMKELEKTVTRNVTKNVTKEVTEKVTKAIRKKMESKGISKETIEEILQ